MIFDAFWKSKNGHFAREVLQKLKFHYNGYQVCSCIDLGVILEQFWGRFGTKFGLKNLIEW